MNLKPILYAGAILCALPAAASDWPALRGGNARDGFTQDRVDPPYELQWIRFWPGETLTTRAEAIAADGKVFAGTYAGRLHALDAETGVDLWTFPADGPILHSPAYAAGSVYFTTASPGKTVYRVSAAKGEVLFSTPCGPGGFSASPLIEGDLVLIGGRDGLFYGLDREKGNVLWTFPTGGPIRNTAAAAGSQVFFASDDLRAYSLELPGGKLLWKSEKLFGQSLRDYSPVIHGGAVIFRTNPMEQMGVHLGRTYGLIGRNAGIDLSTWKNVDAFVKAGKGRGNPEAFEKEERAVLEHLEGHPHSRTFYVLDPATGKEKLRAPVLWGAGCQGVGVPPVGDGAGKLVVFTRSAYGNWTLGVAPLVGLQRLDLSGSLRPPEPALGPLPTARSEPLFHSKGSQPPWNTFWGTADETTNYSCGGGLLYCAHQGTLSAFDLETGDIFTVWGNRDTWGGEKGLPWARNEWHGPARGSAAISGDRLYWVTGSRILAIRGRAQGQGAAPRAAPPAAPRPAPQIAPQAASAGKPAPPEDPPLPPEEAFLRFARERLRGSASAAGAAGGARIALLVEEVLSRPGLAPLLVEIGLGSHDFFFDSSAGTIAALALAYPHLGEDLRTRVKERVRSELKKFPPCGKESRYPLDSSSDRTGSPERRELYTLTAERFFKGWEMPPPVADAYALDLYGDRTGDWEPVRDLWPRARKVYEDPPARDWKLDPEKGDRFMNARIAGLIGIARLAERFGEPQVSEDAARRAASNLRLLCEHWRRGAASLPAGKWVDGVSELDRFIGKGNPFYYAVAPHRHKIAKFLDLTPEVGRAIRETSPGSARRYLDFVDAVMPGWYLAFEERQVHFGENHIDFPDQAFSIFLAKRHIGRADSGALEKVLDIPWCPGDLFFLQKRVLLLEATGVEEWR